jgi:uncharacterized membrane protein YphA (DoxX/SURF4 family)
MRIAVPIIQILVGLLFIVSGLVKANDPLGLSYKMEEFFEIWNADLTNSSFFLKSALISLISFFHEYSLGLSIFIIALEIMAGVALLIGWQKKWVLNVLLALIVFFTFLTAYAYLSGKFKNCGCFGDCLPITPLASFLKDVVLLGLILFLVIGRRYIFQIDRTVQAAVLSIFLFISLGLQWYVLNYMPIADCLPFKKGNKIADQMKIPANAVPDSFAIRFVYEKDGKQHEFSPDNLPDDLDTYTFVDRTDKLIRKGNAEPALKGFSLVSTSNEDSTQYIINQPGYVVLYFFNPDDNEETKRINDLVNALNRKNIPSYAATTQADKLQQHFEKTGVSLPIMKSDVTAFRTAARTNPTIYLLNNGVIEEKWSGKEISQVKEKLQNIPVQKMQ